VHAFTIGKEVMFMRTDRMLNWAVMGFAALVLLSGLYLAIRGHLA